MVTMRDVAAEAGVSPMTVSNALTGRRPVSEATRRVVLEAVDRLGYQVNVAARSLRQGRTGVVGIAVPTLDSHYYSRLAHRLVLAFSQAGLATVVRRRTPAARASSPRSATPGSTPTTGSSSPPSGSPSARSTRSAGRSPSSSSASRNCTRPSTT